ncbi:MAG: hypothetical protein ABL894_10125 [Hyphomicrobium sp.]
MNGLGNSLWIALIAALAGPAASAGLAFYIFSSEPLPIGLANRASSAGIAPATVSEARNVDVASRSSAQQ